MEKVMKKFIKEANKGNPVFITDVRDSFSGLGKKHQQRLSCLLNMVDGTNRLFELNIPPLKKLKPEHLDFVRSYIRAEVYNILCALGGVTMTIYIDTGDADLVELAEGLNETFGIGQDLASRKGYGRCVNVIDRMLSANYGDDAKFKFIVEDVSKIPDLPESRGALKHDMDIFIQAAQNLKGKLICGMDIGGTDIKVALAFNGTLCCLKEYDWFPESFKSAEQLIEPICMLIRLVRCQVSLDMDENLASEDILLHQKVLTSAMHKDATYEVIEQAVIETEKALEGKLIEIDAIGLSFPDVVVKDKIVGGEATKTRGMRENPQIDYEEEFFKITELNNRLLKICRKNGVVKIINDGPMAAFTAAVEIAASKKADSVKDGVFAHTLGTELGTGWVDGAGSIPEIPLECYNFIIDLGDFEAKAFDADDARSINNVNTGLTGTLQKYASQSGVFRLGLKYLKDKRKDLYEEIFDKRFVEQRDDMLVVPTEPEDMRKDFLDYMMAQSEWEENESVKEIFRQVGVYLAITWFETDRILEPGTKVRFLFGRLVKKKICFELIKEGASSRLADLQMEAADASMANTSLMKQLDAHHGFTVAHFGQAIGAIYYGNTGLLAKEDPN